MAIHNFAMIESQGTIFTIRQLDGLNELISSIEERFDMPRRVVAEALSGMEKFRDAWDETSPWWRSVYPNLQPSL